MAMRLRAKQWINFHVDKGKLQLWASACYMERLFDSSPWASSVGPCLFHPRIATVRNFKSAPLQERKMVDRRRIHVKGGDGGDGCTSFRRSRHSRYGEADGGRGGRGGDVILKCSADVWDFGHVQYHNNAGGGGVGSSKRKIGSRGHDKIVRVPVGTVIHLIRGELPLLVEAGAEAEEDTFFGKDLDHEEENARHTRNLPCAGEYFSSEDETGVKYVESEDANDELEFDEEPEPSALFKHDTDNYADDICEPGHERAHDILDELTHKSVSELLKPGETLHVASGGEGGRGNAAMARGRGAEKKLPSRTHEYGRKGTEAFLVLELKTIADVGLVGVPNAGKSTLVGAISRAKPKVGHYAFTTLRPNLGKLEFDDFMSITVADIPGLIKGAHKNVGLGHDFLRHIERTRVLAYVVDLSAGYGDNKGSQPWDQVEELKIELEKYQEGLSLRASLVIGTKLDEEGAKDQLQEFRRRLPSVQIVPVCAILDEGIHELRLSLRELVFDS